MMLSVIPGITMLQYGRSRIFHGSGSAHSETDLIGHVRLAQPFAKLLIVIHDDRFSFLSRPRIGL